MSTYLTKREQAFFEKPERKFRMILLCPMTSFSKSWQYKMERKYSCLELTISYTPRLKKNGVFYFYWEDEEIKNGLDMLKTVGEENIKYVGLCKSEAHKHILKNYDK